MPDVNRRDELPNPNQHGQVLIKLDFSALGDLETREAHTPAVKQWCAEIAVLREKYQLQMVISDFAGYNM